jgi:hypothetical protein
MAAKLHSATIKPIAASGARQVNEPAKGQKAQRVGGLKRGHNVAILNLVPADGFLQRRRQYPEHLAIHVINGRRGKKQRANRPAKAADADRRLHRRPGNSCSVHFLRSLVANCSI